MEGRLRCPVELCGVVDGGERGMWAHAAAIHAAYRPFVCAVCADFRHSTVSLLRAHFLSKHPDTKFAVKQEVDYSKESEVNKILSKAVPVAETETPVQIGSQQSRKGGEKKRERSATPKRPSPNTVKPKRRIAEKKQSSGATLKMELEAKSESSEAANKNSNHHSPTSEPARKEVKVEYGSDDSARKKKALAKRHSLPQQEKWAHRGIHGNEQADRLANDGARMP